jgi:hypothetical protein
VHAAPSRRARTAARRRCCHAAHSHSVRSLSAVSVRAGDGESNGGVRAVDGASMTLTADPASAINLPCLGLVLSPGWLMLSPDFGLVLDATRPVLIGCLFSRISSVNKIFSRLGLELDAARPSCVATGAQPKTKPLNPSSLTPRLNLKRVWRRNRGLFFTIVSLLYLKVGFFGFYRTLKKKDPERDGVGR